MRPAMISALPAPAFVFALSTAHAYISSGSLQDCPCGRCRCAQQVSRLDRQKHLRPLWRRSRSSSGKQQTETVRIIGLNMHSNGAKGVEYLPVAAVLPETSLLGRETGAWLYDHGRTGSVQICCKAGSGVHQRGSGRNWKYQQTILTMFIIHQANYRIIESIAKRLKVDLEKFPVNMEHYGNTSGASVPILLDELNQGRKA